MSQDRISHGTSEFPLRVTAIASATQSTPFAYSSEPAITNSGMIEIGELKVPFGIDNSEIEDRLMALAHEVGLGAIFPQKFTTTSERQIDDFEMITVSLTYGRPRESGS